MNPAETLWQRLIDRRLHTIRSTKPEHIKIRVFGTPAQAQGRILHLTKELELERYEVEHVDLVASALFLTVTDAHFRRAPQS